MLARTDRRLADGEVSEWLLEQADDDPGQQLRDRVLGHGYAAAAAALEDSDDNSPATLADAATVEGERDPTTRLYRAGLQGVRDGEFSLADPVLKLAWLRREHHDPGTDAHRHACAAGVCYAGSLALENDPEMPPAELARQAVDASEDLPDVVLGLHEAIPDGDVATDPDSFTGDIDPEAEPHDIDALERLGHARVLSRLVEPPGPREYYTAALRAVTQREAETAVRGLAAAWNGREEAEDPAEHRDAVAAGVALHAHVELDMLDEEAIEESTLREAVVDRRADLSPAVLALFETATGGELDHDPEELLPEADPDDEEFDRDALEALVCADLVESLISGGEPGGPETTEASGGPDGASPEEMDVAPSEAYAAALQGVLENEPEDAIQAFAAAWALYEETDDLGQQRDAVTAGVALLAHVEIGMLDADAIDRDEVVTAVAVHRRRLSAAATALFDACMGETPSVDPDELRPDADVEPEDLNRGELEAAVLAGLLEHLLNDGTSGGEAPGESDDETEPGAEPGAPDELRSDYETGLEHTEAGERQAAVGPLMDAWDRHDSVGERGRRMACGAGVALAVHVADDGALSMVRDEVLEVLADDTGPLSTPAHAVFEATTGGDPDGTPAELREFAADRDGLDALEARAFAELFDSLTDDPRAEETGGV